jgi:hypothetical protein
MKRIVLQLKCNENFYLFFSFSISYLLLTWVTNTYILTDSTYISLWSDRLSVDRAIQLLESNKRNRWIGYLFVPVFLYIKVLIVAFTFKSGFYLSNIEIPLRHIFKIVLMAELVPVIGLLIQFVYFLLNGVSSIEQLNSFAPFSLLSLFNENEVPVYLSYPLRLLSLYEIAYWILLAIGLKEYLRKSFTKSIGLVASCYGLGLLLWVVFVVFIQVQFGK